MDPSEFKLVGPPPELKARVFAEVRRDRRFRLFVRAVAAALPLLIALNVWIEPDVRPTPKRPNPVVEELADMVDGGAALRARWETQLRSGRPQWRTSL